MTTQSTLDIIVYAPALVARDSRSLAVVHAMERALPGVRLDWKVSEDGRLIALPQRDAWLTEETKDGRFPLVCNDNESYPVTIFGLQMPAHQAPGGRPLLDIHAELPSNESTIAVAADALSGVAEGARAFWGHATPSSAGVEIARQTSDPIRKPGVPPRGLPPLKFAERILIAEIPHRLGWMNYWSTATARALGFPDPARDVDLLSRSRRTELGGWVVRLTDSPLDLDNPAHLNALKRAYERFPEIGGRTAPRDPILRR